MSRVQPYPAPLDITERAEPGVGVARHDGKVVFVTGALPGEQVEALRVRRHSRRDEAQVTAVLRPSADRVPAPCPVYGRCGGCAVQHQDHGAQVADKQALLLEKLTRLGGVTPGRVLPALSGPAWGYRSRARLGVRFVPDKGGVLVGFRERHNGRVAVMDACPVLDARLSALIAPLRELIAGFAAPARLPQIEVAATDDETVLVFRHLDPLPEADRDALAAFAATHGLRVFLQPAGPDSVHPLPPTTDAPLHYTLPDFGLRLAFGPLDFTQQNLALNAALVAQALDLLAVGDGERVADLFCGIGNFTLPLARQGARVRGIEGDAALVARARANARANGLGDAAQFEAADLYANGAAVVAGLGGLDALLLDPPRSGALEVCQALAALPARAAPGRIAYVSCNPATLARDAGVLAPAGYTLEAAGIVDLFPHTAHVESMALFTRSRAGV